MKKIVLFLIPILLFPFEAKVIKIIDGDTFTVLQGTNELKIRLWGVDAPERMQAFGQETINYLNSSMLNKTVEIKSLGEDPYHRILGLVYMYEKNINEKLVKEGYAWAYFIDNKHPELQLKWKAFQSQAKIERVGLWASTNAIKPYDFRKQFLQQQYKVE